MKAKVEFGPISAWGLVRRRKTRGTVLTGGAASLEGRHRSTNGRLAGGGVGGGAAGAGD